MNIANKVTLVRIVLIPLFVASIVYYRGDAQGMLVLPLIIFGVAVITDGLDGFIARRFNQKTQLGTIIDPLADKLLILTGFLCIIVSKNIRTAMNLPPWVPIVVISRDIVIILGATIIHVIKGSVQVKPSLLGKVTTVFQMSAILAVLVRLPYTGIIWNLAGLFTILSGIDYMTRGSRLLNNHHG